MFTTFYFCALTGRIPEKGKVKASWHVKLKYIKKSLNLEMYTLINLVTLIFSFIPSTVILRLFVIEKGGRARDPDTGRFVSKRYVKVASLVTSMLCYFFIEPIMSNLISDICSYNPLNVYLLLIVGIIIYFFILK